MLVNGKHVSLGSYTQKADANAALRDALGARDAGTWVEPRQGRVAFGTYAKEWIAGRHDLAMRTRHDYEDLLRLHLEPAFGATTLADLSVMSVRRWWAHASGPDGHGRAPKTYRLLRAILNTAVTDGLIARNPCRIKGAGVDKTPERPTVTVEQVYAIADAIAPRYRALVLLAAFSGLRFGELRALRRRRLDLPGGLVTVAPGDGNVQRDRSGAPRFTRPKSRAGARTVAIPAPIVAEMHAHLDLAAVDGLPDGLVLHDLRHSGKHPRRRHRRQHQGADGPHGPRQPPRRPDLPARLGRAGQSDRRGPRHPDPQVRSRWLMTPPPNRAGRCDRAPGRRQPPAAG